MELCAGFSPWEWRGRRAGSTQEGTSSLSDLLLLFSAPCWLLLFLSVFLPLFDWFSTVNSHPAEEERGVYCISNVLGKQVKFLIVSFVLLLLPCFTAVVQQERALVFRGYKNTLVPSVVTKYAAEWSSAEVFNRRPVSPKRSMKALQQGRKMFGYLK